MLSFDLLLAYGLKNDLISTEDLDYVNNHLSNLLRIEPNQIKSLKYNQENLDDILAPILTNAVKNKLIKDNLEEKDNFEALLLDLFTPRPSQLTSTFNRLYKINPDKATNYLYNLMIKNNYIKQTRVNKNIKYKYKSNYGDLEITINVSKPEKDNKSVQADFKIDSSNNYPQCVLCKENVGFYGKNRFNGRSNHRVIPLTINQESFQFQYSPYVYYQEHAIVLAAKHTPMKISQLTFKRLIGFVEMFPKYFIGSNAALPIVGGSILAHEHYQAGKYKFPIESAKAFKTFKINGVEVGLLIWPLATLRLRSKSSSAIIKLAEKIRVTFETYQDSEAGIIPMSGKVKHNTITPIARLKNGVYEFDIALRNNRTSEQYPDGIFHNHPEVFDVKKESIGLIEVMGLAILPGRLATDLIELEKYLKGRIKTFNNIGLYPNLIKRLKANKKLINRDGIRQVVAKMFEQGLEDCGVFKQTPIGRAQFIRFVEKIISKKD